MTLLSEDALAFLGQTPVGGGVNNTDSFSREDS